MKECLECGSEMLSIPPQRLTTAPIYECGECGWRGKFPLNRMKEMRDQNQEIYERMGKV